MGAVAQRALLAVLASLFITLLLCVPLSFTKSGLRLSLLQVLTRQILSPLPMDDSVRCKKLRQPATLSSTQSKHAYVTLLSVDGQNNNTGLDDDLYFIAMRMQAYQLLHAPTTRSHDIPYIVLASHGTVEDKKARLRSDGAIVLDIDSIPLPEWFPETLFPKWANMFDKLRVWELLTQFETVLFLDADVILTAPLDGIFNTVASRHGGPDDRLVQTTLDEYIFAASLEVAHEHHFPPTAEGGDLAKGGDYINAGFFLTKPSTDMFSHYLELLEVPNSFPTALMEQDFFNHVHRLDGPLPFQRLDPIWNIHFPTQEDLDAGVRSLHAHWWDPSHTVLLPYFVSWRHRMEGFFEAWDASTHASFSTADKADS